MISSKKREALFLQALDRESNLPEKCFWMSFCDPDKPNGTQFLGVVITNARGIAHAVDKTHALGINPGGEVRSYETDSRDIKPEHFDKLMSKDDLVNAGYC